MKKNIAIVSGGNTSEYEISIQSGETVYNNMDTSLYNPFLMILRGNSWVIKRKNEKEIAINKNDFSCVIDGKKIHFDCVFIAIHGNPGEDGKLQGYLDMLKIPYTTSGVLACSLTFDKTACKTFLESSQIIMAPSVLIYKGSDPSHRSMIDKTGLPCFVKPNNGGSSCGISKVVKENELQVAIDRAFIEDKEVIVEGFIEGRELTCGVFKYKGEIRVLGVTEIVSKNEFFDYEAKYSKGMAEEITPADISAPLSEECKNLSVKLYKTLNLKGIVRFDYILKDNKFYFLEVNTVPGLTATSLIPQQASYSGYSLKELFNKVLEETLEG